MNRHFCMILRVADNHLDVINTDRCLGVLKYEVNFLLNINTIFRIS
jgi:hypothetical protein